MVVRTAIAHPIDALPRTPFPASRDFPSRGNERYEGKNSESYTSRTISAFPLFGGYRHHLARWEACHMTLKGEFVTLTLYSSPKGRYHNPQRRRRCRPLSGSDATLLHNPRRQPRPFFKTCGESCHHHPLNPLNLLNPLNPHAEGVSFPISPYPISVIQ